MRTALGAGRGRLIRQFLTESLLLSVLGGAAGLLLGTWGLRALLATSPDSLPRVGDIRLDASVLAVTLGLSLLTGVLFELTPLLHMTARNLATSLRDGGGRSTSGSAKMRLRSVLVAAEIALAVVLVIGAGLMLRSFSSTAAGRPRLRSGGSTHLSTLPATFELPRRICPASVLRRAPREHRQHRRRDLGHSHERAASAAKGQRQRHGVRRTRAERGRAAAQR